MTGPRSPTSADSADHPLRAALMRGDRVLARSAPALRHLLTARDPALIGEAVVAHVGGMLADLARQLAEAVQEPGDPNGAEAALLDRLLANDELRAHCHALALEWRLALRLEAELALDPVLAPLIQVLVAEGDAAAGALAMAALAAQARFAQAQRRMQLPLGELPGELFHGVLIALRETWPKLAPSADQALRSQYEEGAGRLALLGRLASESGAQAARLLVVEEAGAALWLTALAARSGQTRERIACAAADPQLGRLLLTLRAAGMAPGEAERQALIVQPDALLPAGLQDIGTREAAQWLAEARA